MQEGGRTNDNAKPDGVDRANMEPQPSGAGSDQTKEAYPLFVNSMSDLSTNEYPTITSIKFSTPFDSHRVTPCSKTSVRSICETSIG